MRRPLVVPTFGLLCVVAVVAAADDPSPSPVSWQAFFELTGDQVADPPLPPSPVTWQALFEVNGAHVADPPLPPAPSSWQAFFELTGGQVANPPPPNSPVVWQALFEVTGALQPNPPPPPSPVAWMAVFERLTTSVPDLRAADADAAPLDLVVGEPLTLDGTIVNAGADIPAGLALGLAWVTADGRTLATDRVTDGLTGGTPVAPHARTRTTTVAAPACTDGPVAVRFTVDTGAAFPDANPADNTATSTARLSIRCPAATPVCFEGACRKADGATCTTRAECGADYCTPDHLCCPADALDPPLFTGVPGPVAAEAAGPAGAAVTYTPPAATSVHDGVDLVVSCLPPSGATFPRGTTTVSCSATDTCGHRGLTAFAVVVTDAAGPVLTVPDDLVVEATQPGGALVTFTATATDATDGDRPVTCTPASGALFARGSTTVACAASDTTGNRTTRSFAVLVRDTTAPAITDVPATRLVEATSGSGATVAWTSPLATDAVDATAAVTCTPASGATFPLGTTTVACVTADAAGNVAHASFDVTVRDTTRPVLTATPPARAAADGPNGTVVTFATSATDLVDGTVPVLCTPPSGALFPVGSTTARCTATDRAGNAATTTVEVVVLDSDAPTLVLTVPGPVEAVGPAGAVVTWVARGADLVDGDLTPACTPASGGTFAVGDAVVSCAVEDSAGNRATRSFTVRVVDTRAPALVVPQDLVREATGPDGAAVTYSASASDLVDGNVAPACAPASGTTFRLGATDVSCTATDRAGNARAGTFRVIVRDTTAPVFTALPADAELAATLPDGAPAAYTPPGATDAADTDVTVACAPPPGTTIPFGTTTIACTAEDDAGNRTRATFRLTVADTSPPVLTLTPPGPADVTGPNGAAVAWTSSAMDAIDGVVPVTCAPPSASLFPRGVTPVRCEARDRAGNVARSDFEVVVNDSGAPRVSIEAPASLEATGPDGAVVTFTAAATDTVDGTRPTECTPASGATFPLGETTISCSAADVPGNTGFATARVRIVDTTRPTLTVPDDQRFEAASPSGTTWTFETTASDVADPGPTVACTTPPDDTFPIGTTEVACTATDASGNATTRAFLVRVVDTTPPVLDAVPGLLEVEANSPEGATVAWEGPIVRDAADPSPASDCQPASGGLFPIGRTTVRCTATDARGNETAATFDVIVRDDQPPSLDLPALASAEPTGPDGAVVTFPAAADDAIDGPLLVACEPPSGSVFPLGETRAACVARDSRGNTTTGSLTVLVLDTTPPALTVPEDRTVEALGADGTPVSFTATAADIVDGAPVVDCVPVSGSTFPIGDVDVRCTAADAAGNAVSAGFVVHVVDTTPPALTLPPTRVAEATGAPGAVVTFEVSAQDAVDAAPALACDHASGDTFPPGTTSVGCTATDTSGNTATGSFLVVVTDTTPPVLTLPATASGVAGASGTAVVGWTASALDLVDGATSVTCDPPPGSEFPVGDTTVPCDSVDARGNRATGSLVVHVDAAPEAPSGGCGCGPGASNLGWLLALLLGRRRRR